MSGRIRTVKPEWLEDELLAAASDEARVLSVALLLMADDHGRGRASIATIAAGAWRYQMERDDGAHAPEVLAKASRALRELVETGFVVLYEVARQRYFAIRNWAKHQKVDKPSKPRVPGPDQAENTEETASSRDPRECFARPPRDPRETLAPDLRSPISDQDHEHRACAREPGDPGNPDGLRAALRRGYRERYLAESKREPSQSRLSSPKWDEVCAELERRCPRDPPAVVAKRALDAFFACPRAKRLGWPVGQLASDVDAYALGRPAEPDDPKRPGATAPAYGPRIGVLD